MLLMDGSKTVCSFHELLLLLHLCYSQHFCISFSEAERALRATVQSGLSNYKSNTKWPGLWCIKKFEKCVFLKRPLFLRCKIWILVYFLSSFFFPSVVSGPGVCVPTLHVYLTNAYGVFICWAAIASYPASTFGSGSGVGPRVASQYHHHLFSSMQIKRPQSIINYLNYSNFSSFTSFFFLFLSSSPHFTHTIHH